jgi:geranylgeranyl pyrophosphate synthase
MTKDLYKKLMTETSAEIGDVILSYLEPLKKEDSKLYDICSELIFKKIGTFETRAYLMRFSFEACSGKKWTDEIKHACAAVELELASMYYANRIFDGKGGKEILQKPNLQFIAAMITRDLASQALTHACLKLDYEKFVKVKDIFDEINKVMYIGQFFEIEKNLYSDNIELDFDKMLELYYKRNYGVNGSYFEKIAITGGIFGGGTEKQINALSEFSKNFGMVQQIINDIGDFVPPEHNLGTEEKLPEDAYSDIKHGKLMLPVIYTLVKGRDKEKTLLIKALKNQATPAELLDITKIIVNNGAISYSRKIVLDFVKKAKSYLSIFDSETKDLFEGMCFVAYTHRYYKELDKLKNSRQRKN